MIKPAFFIIANRKKFAPLLALSVLACQAEVPPNTSPEANTRTYAQNYKDMVLATCIANAYQKDEHASLDAGSSVSALRDWTEYDFDESPDAVKALVDSYLSRDYRNPLVESEIKGVRFDFLKCLDLYHSKELQALVERLVIAPEK